MLSDDSRSSYVVLSYVDEANVAPPRNHASPTPTAASNADHSRHYYQHEQQQQQQQQRHPMTGVNQPQQPVIPTNLQRYATAVSPPPYWSSAGAMTSRGGVASPGRYAVGHRRQQLRHDDVSDDVTSSPVYAEKVAAELVETERTYVAELQQIVQVTSSSSPSPPSRK